MPRHMQKRRAIGVDKLRELMTSAKSGNPETIRHKASEMGIDLNSVNLCGKNLLTIAIKDNEAPSTVEAIINAGADVDHPNNQGKTALMMAVKTRRPDIFKVLIEHGANPRLKTPKGISAISLCLKRELYSYLEILLRKSINGVDSMIEHLEEICLFIRMTNNKSKETNRSDFVCPYLNVDPRLILAIKNVYDVNIKDMNGTTPLIYAVRGHYDDCVKLLLLVGADVNKINKRKETGLTIAMSRSHNPILKDLIRAGALRRHPRGKTSTLHFGMFKMILDYLQQNGLFNIPDIYGKTALMYAAERGDKECIMYAVEMDIEEFVKAKFLLDDKDKSARCVGDGYVGASVSSPCAANETDDHLLEDKIKYQDNNGRPIIMYAFETGKMLLDSYIQSRVSGSSEYRDADGRTILMNCFKFYDQNTFDIATQLVLNIAQKNTPDSISSIMSAFQLAYKTIGELFDGKANLRDKWGDSTIIYAIRYCDFLTEEITKLLVGDTHKEQYQDGKTALMIAVSGYNGGSHTYIEPLIGDSCSIQDKDGKTALMYALINKKLVPDYLLEQMIGDSQNLQDNDGKTALMYALNNKLVSDVLLKQMIGDSQILQDKNGKTALMYAFILKKQVSEEMIELLAGETPFIQDNTGKTALMYAFECEQNLTYLNIHKLFGLKFDIRDNEGNTTLIYALKYDLNLTEEIISILVGDRATERYQNGQTALMIALQLYNTNLKKYRRRQFKRRFYTPYSEWEMFLLKKDRREDFSHPFYGDMSSQHHSEYMEGHYLKPLVGESCSIQDDCGKTALMYAVIKAHGISKSIIKMMIGDTQNIQDNDGKTALMYALINKERSSENIIQMLIGDTQNIQDNDGKTALMYALINKERSSENILQMMIGDSQNIQDNDGKTALMYALINKERISENILQMMIGDSQNIQDNDGKTALMYAFLHKKQPSKRLISHLSGETPFIQDNSGKTALMYAFKCNQYLTYSSIQKLFGGKVDICDNDGDTLLIYALKFYKHINEEIANLLVGDSQQAQYQHGKTALMIALERNTNLNGIRHFLQSIIDCSCDVQDNNGRTALMYAMRHSSLLPEHLFDQMIRQSQFIQDNEGKTALMYASLGSFFSNTNNFTIKLFHKDALNIQDNEGKTALHYAIEHHQSDEYVEQLILHGLNLEVEDKQKRTALVLCLEIDTRINVFMYEGRENFMKTKMLLKCNPMPIIGLLGKMSLLTFIQSGMFSLNNLWRDKEIFRLMIINGIEPFPHLRKKMSTFFAVLKENLIDVAKYLIANMYFTNEDLLLLIKAKNYLKSDEYLRKHKMLVNGTYLDLSSPDLQHLITEATSQPWPLVKLSFVVVSSAVGHGTNREDRVNRLPLPNPIKDSLMFNTRTALIPVSEWSNITMASY